MRCSLLTICGGAALLLFPSAAPGASPDDEMHAAITIKMNWDKQFERTHESGSASVRITGKIKLTEEDGDTVKVPGTNISIGKGA